MDPAAFFCPEACQRLPMFARVFKRLSVSAEGAGAASPDGEDVAGAVPESEGDEAVPVPEPPARRRCSWTAATPAATF